MVSETLQPLISELPINEKRRLLEWLKNEVDEKPEPEVNQHLMNKLIRHIEKAKSKNTK